MSGDRSFDDDRWPDQEGFASCFLCGRRVDPLDPKRGTYTANAAACEPLPIHVPCLDGQPLGQVRTAFMYALVVMGEANAKQARQAANVSAPSPVAH